MFRSPEKLQVQNPESINADTSFETAFAQLPTVDQVLRQVEGFGDQEPLYDLLETAEPLVRRLNGMPDGAGLVAELLEKYDSDSDYAGTREHYAGFKGSRDVEKLSNLQIVAELKQALRAETDHCIKDNLLKPNDVLDVAQEITEDSPMADIMGKIYDMFVSAMPDEKQAATVADFLSASSNYTTFNVYLGDSSKRAYFREPAYGPREIVLSKTCAESFGELFADAIKGSKWTSEEIEKRLGYSTKELGARYVYAHEFGHLMAATFNDRGAPGVSWEPTYLFKNPAEMLSPNLSDAISAEGERWAEGIAQLYLQAEFVTHGLDDAQLLERLLAACHKSAINGGTEVFEALHMSDQPLGYEKDGPFKRAASLGYGLPLSWGEIYDRLQYLMSEEWTDRSQQRENVKKRLQLSSEQFKDYIEEHGYDPGALQDYVRSANEHFKRTAERDKRNEKIKTALSVGALVGAGLFTAFSIGKGVQQNRDASKLSIEQAMATGQFRDIQVEATGKHRIISAELADSTLNDKGLLNIAESLLDKPSSTVVVHELKGPNMEIAAVSPHTEVILGPEFGSEANLSIDFTQDKNRGAAINDAVKSLSKIHPNMSSNTLYQEVTQALMQKGYGVNKANTIAAGVYTLNVNDIK